MWAIWHPKCNTISRNAGKIIIRQIAAIYYFVLLYKVDMTVDGTLQAAIQTTAII